ncbi:hypothetical protein D3C72_1775870 [compost metagenome]
MVSREPAQSPEWNWKACATPRGKASIAAPARETPINFPLHLCRTSRPKSTDLPSINAFIVTTFIFIVDLQADACMDVVFSQGRRGEWKDCGSRISSREKLSDWINMRITRYLVNAVVAKGDSESCRFAERKFAIRAPAAGAVPGRLCGSYCLRLCRTRSKRGGALLIDCSNACAFLSRR